MYDTQLYLIHIPLFVGPILFIQFKQELQPHFTVLGGCYISITCPVPCRISYRTRRKQNTIETVVRLTKTNYERV